MSSYLLIDVGAGTQDILWWDDEQDLSYKAVVSSPVRRVAAKAASLPKGQPLLVTGREMGGGPITRVLKERAKESPVFITKSAAATLHHNKERVRAMGLQIVEDGIEPREGQLRLRLGDIDVAEIEKIVTSFGVDFDFDFVAVCAQDHGVPPPGISHLVYRQDKFVKTLTENPFPHELLYRHDEIEPTWNRLRSMALDAKELPTQEVYVMDSGMAAILGATHDRSCVHRKYSAVLDVATSHTVGAIFSQQELLGLFEVHTKDLKVEELDELLPALAKGELDNEAVLQQGGHGAWSRGAAPFAEIGPIVATGPQRRRVKDSKLEIHWGAPMGDNMMTGTTGLLAALRRRQGFHTENLFQ